MRLSCRKSLASGWAESHNTSKTNGTGTAGISKPHEPAHLEGVVQVAAGMVGGQPASSIRGDPGIRASVRGGRSGMASKIGGKDTAELVTDLFEEVSAEGSNAMPRQTHQT